LELKGSGRIIKARVAIHAIGVSDNHSKLVTVVPVPASNPAFYRFTVETLSRTL